MKVGILTVNRAINVGAVLQAYALQEILRSIGHDAWVINYMQPEVENSNRPKHTFSKMLKLLFQGHLRSVCYYPSSIRGQEIKNSHFDYFLNHYLHCTPICNKDTIPTDFDAYVIGSDQVWNWNIFHRQDPVFWGLFNKKENAKLVSYAASTSKESLQKTDKSFIENALSKFSLISVREEPSAQFLNQEYNIPIEVTTNIDPTLAANPEIWNKFESDIVPNEPYIFAYAARSYKKNPPLFVQRANELGKKMNCRVVFMSYLNHSPVDYVALIKHAQAVITSSFHGVAFSLIFNKQLFAMLYSDEQDYRYRALLESLDASDRLFEINSNIAVRTQDYRNVKAKLMKKAEESFDYLKKISHD